MKTWKLFIPPVLVGIASFILPFVYWPEMLNWPLILSHGWLPYRDFSIIHTPILPLLLMFSFRVFGFMPFTLHLVGTLFIFLSNLLIVLLTKKITKNTLTAVISGLVYGFMIFSFEGNTVWFESLLAPLLVMVFWFQWDFLKTFSIRKIFFSGVLMSVVLLVKQTAVFILPEFFIILAYLFWIKKRNLKFLVKICFVYMIPIIFFAFAFLSILYRLNILGDFIAWSFTFPFLLPSMKLPGLEPDILLPTIRQTILLLVFITTAVIFTIKSKSFGGIFLATWTGLSLLFTYPRFEYFHLLVFAAFFALLTGYSFDKFKNRSVFFLMLGINIILVLPVFRTTYIEGQRFLNDEVITVSHWLSDNYPMSSIFSLNGPDLVYFLTNKPPAVKPWVDQLPWEMAFAGEKFTSAFKRSRPEIIVFRPYLKEPVNGLGAYQPKEIVDFVSKNYHLIKIFPGGVQILKRNE